MVESKQSKPKTGVGCLILFSLPFAATGVVMTFLVAKSVVGYLDARSWEEVSAKIVSAELKRSDDSDGGTTYRAVATYDYVYHDQNYRGERVSFHGGSDNIGSFHKDIYKELSQHQKTGQPFRCYVNPDEPSESVLYRDLRWEMLCFMMLFALVFGGVGFGLLFGSVWGYRQAKAENVYKEQYPEEPWRWKEEWGGGRIQSSSKPKMIAAIVFATFWNLVSAPLWFILPNEVVDKGNRMALLGAIFPVVGIGLIVWAIRTVLRWRKYGESLFEMASVPGVVGGTLAGVIHTSQHIAPEGGFHVTLNCVRKRTTGSSKNRRTSETILWQDERTMAREMLKDDLTQSAIPVLFHVPYDQPQTSEEDSSNQVTWKLKVEAATPGIDYSASFDVPVFETPESDPDFVLDESLLADYVARTDPEADLRSAGVVRTASPDGWAQRFVFPMARCLGSAIGMSVFLLIWIGAIVMMRQLEAPILFPIVFGLFGLLILLIVLDLWFYRSVVDVSPDGITVRAGLMGTGREQRIDVGDLDQIKPKSGMQSGNRIYYQIVAHHGLAKKTTLAKYLPGKMQAENVIREIEKALGQKPSE